MSQSTESDAFAALFFILIGIVFLIVLSLIFGAESYFDNQSVQMCLELTKSEKCLEVLNVN